MRPIIAGYFKDGFWKVKSQLYFNGERNLTEVDFIIDTGSEITVLSPITANKLGIRFDDCLSNDEELDIEGPSKFKPKKIQSTSHIGIIFRVKNWPDDIMIQDVVPDKSSETSHNMLLNPENERDIAAFIILDSNRGGMNQDRFYVPDSPWEKDYNILGLNILKHFNIILNSKTNKAILICIDENFLTVPR
jgi:hypothetical protein